MISANAPITGQPVIQMQNELASNIRSIPNETAKPQIIHTENDKTIVVEQTLSLAEIEKETIIKALKKHRNRKDAARELGISERTLYRKVKDYNLKL
jgi:transcriptional regulator with PAS, ATPase and Fis domain